MRLAVRGNGFHAIRAHDQIVGHFHQEAVFGVRGRHAQVAAAATPEKAVALLREQIARSVPILTEERRRMDVLDIEEPEVDHRLGSGEDAGVHPLLAGRAHMRQLLRHLDAERLREEEAHGASVAQRDGDLVLVGGLAVGDVGYLHIRVPGVLVLAAVRRAVCDKQLVVKPAEARERERERRLRLPRDAQRRRLRRHCGHKNQSTDKLSHCYSSFFTW